ncbi:MAG: glycerophosphodiester phosphodiesterase family protein, partial [Actinomycetes bacterium]
TTTTTTEPLGPCALAPDTRVGDLTLAELRRYELNNGEPIPTFAEFLDLANAAKVGVLPEIKYFPAVADGPKVPWTESQLAEYRSMIAERTKLRQVLMGSFEESALAYFADKEPTWKRVWFRGIGGGDAFEPPTVDEMRRRAPSANVLGVINVLYVQGPFAPNGRTYNVPAAFGAAGIPVYVWFNVTTKGDAPEGAAPFAGVPSLGWTGITALQPRNVRWIATDRPADYAAWSKAAAPAPVMVAHRGGGEDGVSENSLGAFRAAIASGADVLETDVQWTKPTPDNPTGTPVLMHDATINRTARCPNT